MNDQNAKISHTYQQTAPCVWWSSPPLPLVCWSMLSCWCATAQTAAVVWEASPDSSILHRSTQTHTHTQISYGVVAVMMQLYLDIKPYSIDNFQKFSYKYIYTQITHVHLLNTLCDCTLIPRLQTFNIKPLLLPETGGKKCGSVPTSHNFQFRGNLHFN